MSNDITLIKGLTFINSGFKPLARLYYFEGNFFQPIEVDGREIGRIKRAIRQFLKENSEMVKADRAKPDYKNLIELFDEQMKNLEQL